MPVLANTAIVLDASFISSLTSNYSLGIILGLFLGKPLGVFVFTFIITKLKIATMPQGSSWSQVISGLILESGNRYRFHCGHWFHNVNLYLYTRFY